MNRGTKHTETHSDGTVTTTWEITNSDSKLTATGTLTFANGQQLHIRLRPGESQEVSGVSYAGEKTSRPSESIAWVGGEGNSANFQMRRTKRC